MLALPTRLFATGSQLFGTIGRARVEKARLPPREARYLRGERLMRAAAESCRVHGLEVRVDGALPRRPAMLVANHLSYLDALVLPTLTPSTIVAKGEVRAWPLLGSAADALGILFVERGNPWSGALVLRRALRALASGLCVLGFPEGTTSDGRDVLPFHRGLFGLAQLADVPVVPLAISYGSAALRWFGDEWFLPHYLRTAMRPRSFVHVRIGAPLPPLASPSPEALAARARERVRAMLQRALA